MTGSEESPSFRLAYVPGVTPAKWVRIWNERLPDVPLTLVAVSAAEVSDVLREGGADAGLVRLPVDRTVFSAIPLYTETTVVVVPKDHIVAAVDEVAVEDLADDIVLHPLDDTLGWERPPGRPAIERPATTADAIELVAAGVGLLVVPQSLARLHHRRDLTYRPVTDAPAVAASRCHGRRTRPPTWWRTSSGSSAGGPSTAPGVALRPRRSRSASPRRARPGSRKAATGKATSGKAASGKSASGRAAGAGKNPRGRAAAPKGARGAKGGKPRRRS